MASKRATAKKRAPKPPPPPPSIVVDVALGTVKGVTAGQRARLNAYVKNHLATWVTADIKGDPNIPIACRDHFGPPSPAGYDGGDDKGGDG